MTAVLLSFIFFKLSYTPGGLQSPFWAYTQSIGTVISTMVVISALFVGFLLGEGINNAGRTELKRYLSAAPLSDHGFSLLLIRNLVKTGQSGLFLVTAELPAESSYDDFVFWR